MNTNEYEIVYANGGLIELMRAAAADGVEVTSDDVETTINEMGTDAPYRDGEHRPGSMSGPSGSGCAPTSRPVRSPRITEPVSCTSRSTPTLTPTGPRRFGIGGATPPKTLGATSTTNTPAWGCPILGPR